MPKLYFRYGAMNSSKTANLLMVAHNYKSQGKKIFLVKPEIDTRFGDTTINSRAGMISNADLVVKHDTDIRQALYSTSFIPNNKLVYPEKPTDLFLGKDEVIDCILVDECQFLSKSHIDQLREISHFIPVICYGLRTDYKLELFTGSKRLMEVADTIEEIKTVCVYCNTKAIVNAKFRIIQHESGLKSKELIKSGPSEPELGHEDKYQPMCFGCWSRN